MANADSKAPKRHLLFGHILSGLASLFLLGDGGAKLFKPKPVVDVMTQLGYPESSIVGIGALLIVCTLLYLVPRTSILGAVLLTGYLGGAVATHVRVSAPRFNMFFAVMIGVLVWAGLWLKEPRVRQLLPVKDS